MRGIWVEYEDINGTVYVCLGNHGHSILPGLTFPYNGNANDSQAIATVMSDYVQGEEAVSIEIL